MGILSTLIWLPIIGGLVVLLSGRFAAERWLSLAISILVFILSLPLYMSFDAATASMQFVERMPWITAFNVEYYLGVDGFSMPLIVLTTFLTPLIVIAGWEVIKKYVELGLGISITTDVCLTDDDNLVKRPMNKYFPERSYGIITRRGKFLSPAAKKYIELMREAYSPEE